MPKFLAAIPAEDRDMVARDDRMRELIEDLGLDVEEMLQAAAET